MAAEQPAGVLDLQVALEHRLEQIAGGGREHDDEPEHQCLPDHEVVVAVLVEGDERDEQACDRADDEALPGLARRERRRELVPPHQPPAEVRERIRRPDGEQHGEGEQARLVVQLAQQQQMSEPEADPGGAEHGRGDCGGRRSPCLGNGVQCECDDERREKPAEQPDHAAGLCADEGEHGADVRRRHERPQRARHRHELVHGDECGCGDDAEQPPAAEPHHAEHERQADERDQDAGEESSHLPPNLRRRLA